MRLDDWSSKVMVVFALKYRREVVIACVLWCTLATAASAEPPKPIMTLEGRYAALSPDGKRLVGSVPGKSWRATDLKVWDVATGQVLMLMKGHTNNIWQVSFSPDGKRLASNENWVVNVWDLEARREISSFKTPEFTRCVIFICDGKQLATGHDDGRVILWDVKTSRRVRTLKGHVDWVPGLVLSADGKHLASASVDMTAKVWDLETGNAIRTLKGHTWYLNRVAFGPLGKRLATSSDDMTARIWDLETGDELLVLRGHTDWVVAVAFSPDGKWVATGSSDHTARLWDATTGNELLTIGGHTERVGCVTFSPDGKTLVTADNNNVVKLWDVHSLFPRE